MLIFVGSLIVLFSAFGFRLWLFYETESVENEVSIIQQKETEYLDKISLLSQRLEKDEVVTEFKTLMTKGIPKCSFSGIKLLCKDTWIKTKVPTTRVVGKVQDPRVLEQIKAQEKKLKDLRSELEKVTNKANRVSKLEEFTSVNFQQFLSLIFLFAALYILLSKKYNDESQKWAMGTLGTIIGFWLGG